MNWCACPEGPHFGAQMAGTPIRCERCGRDEHSDEREAAILREERTAEVAHADGKDCPICEHIALADVIAAEERMLDRAEAAEAQRDALRDAIEEYMRMLGGSVPPYYRDRIRSALAVRVHRGGPEGWPHA